MTGTGGIGSFIGSPIGGVYPATAGAIEILDAGTGEFILTGQGTLFQVQAVIDVGSFALSGQDVLFATSIVIDAGSFTLDGQDALFQAQLAVETGSFTLTGQASLFTITLVLDEGVFTLSGQDALSVVEAIFDVGSFEWTGQDALFQAQWVSEPGHFVLTGGDIDSQNLPTIISHWLADEERGFEKNLRAFAVQRRRDQEEQEIQLLMDLEAKLITEALAPFVGMKNAA